MERVAIFKNYIEDVLTECEKLDRNSGVIVLVKNYQDSNLARLQIEVMLQYKINVFCSWNYGDESAFDIILTWDRFEKSFYVEKSFRHSKEKGFYLHFPDVKSKDESDYKSKYHRKEKEYETLGDNYQAVYKLLGSTQKEFRILQKEYSSLFEKYVKEKAKNDGS